jgi:hypothetical protein
VSPRRLTTILACGPLLAAPRLDAQSAPPPIIAACYVPGSGTIRIDATAGPAPGAPASCTSSTHVPFKWNQQGVKGDKGDPGTVGPDLTLAGTLSVARTGRFGGGLLAAADAPLAVPSGWGSRMMWVPQKFAFRAGQAQSDNWDEASIGQGSVAFGINTTASGFGAVAMGGGSLASAPFAVALGNMTGALAPGAVALGFNSAAGDGAGRGLWAVALGAMTRAYGEASIAAGYRGPPTPTSAPPRTTSSSFARAAARPSTRTRGARRACSSRRAAAPGRRSPTRGRRPRSVPWTARRC